MIGNSMAERIEDGSIVGIDRGLTQVVDGEIYAIEHDGMLRIKYLHRMPGNALRLRSHNSAEHPDEIFAPRRSKSNESISWVGILVVDPGQTPAGGAVSLIGYGPSTLHHPRGREPAREEAPKISTND